VSGVLSTVKKIGPVLELFSPERPEWRLTDIACALDMPKSSAHALLATLAEIGLLSVTARGRYRLGWNLLGLSERMRASLGLREHAVPAMRALAATVRETVLLAALDRHEVIYLERAEGSHPTVRFAGVRIGSRVPAHSTAVGKVQLAYREADEVRAALTAAHSDGSLRTMTAKTIVSLDDLERELVRVRARGLAIDRGETVPDVNCMAAPIFDRYGAVVAGLSVSVPAYRFSTGRDTLVEPLKDAARTISQTLAAAHAEARTAGLEHELAGVLG
jgi:IclR family KDG regulon transcriptional repressor